MTSSTISIKLNTIGDKVDNNINFTPSMINPEMRETIIYMPPTFKLSDSLIKKAVKDSTSIEEVLTKPSMFQALVRFSTDQAKGYDRISLEEAESKGINKHNFEFMQNLWLKTGKRIFIQDRAYDITESEIVNTTSPKSKNDLRFTMTVKIKVIQSKRNTLLNRTRMNCDEKREKINKIMQEFGWRPWFSYRDPSTQVGEAPVMYSSSKTGINTANAPGKQNPQQINPFAYPNSRGIAPYGMLPPGAAAVPVAFAYPPPLPTAAARGGRKKKSTRRTKRRRKRRSSTSKRRA